MNCVVKQYLHSFTRSRPSNLHKFLALVEWSYNTSLHLSTRVTPYEVIYGKPPPSIPHYVFGSTTNEAMDSLLLMCDIIYALLHRHFLKAQEHMKFYADVKRQGWTMGIC